jgi:hypothetical protein
MHHPLRGIRLEGPGGCFRSAGGRGHRRTAWNPEITLGPGEALPSIVALAAEYRVTTDPVQKGLRILKAEGLVTSVPGYGIFVAE